MDGVLNVNVSVADKSAHVEHRSTLAPNSKFGDEIRTFVTKCSREFQQRHVDFSNEMCISTAKREFQLRIISFSSDM